MNRTVKRFLFPVILFIIFFAAITLTPAEYTDTTGAVSTVAMIIILPLAVITLIWSIVGAVNDHKLRAAGISVDDRLFPVIDQAKNVIQKDKAEGESLPEDLKQRKTKLRIWGVSLIICGFAFIFLGMIITATLMMIGGCALFFSSSPQSYSENVDGINLLVCPPEYTLDRVYEDFKEYKTIHGSVYRGTTFPNCPALFWKGKDEEGLFYFYKPKKQNLAYIGVGADVGCKKLSEPLYPAEKPVINDFQDALRFNLEYHNFSEDLGNVIRNYLKTGEVLPMPVYQKGSVYFLEEGFKLTGQRFTVFNAAQEPVYYVESPFPTKTIRIFDRQENEVFRVTKELVHAMPHYLFYKDGKVLGEFEKQINLVRDSFAMQMTDGLLEMKEINILLGDNYTVNLDEKRIGLIAEKLNFTLENIVFDNMVLTVYDEKNLPLLIALGVMAVREMERDRETDS